MNADLRGFLEASLPAAPSSKPGASRVASALSRGAGVHRTSRACRQSPQVAAGRRRAEDRHGHPGGARRAVQLQRHDRRDRPRRAHAPRALHPAARRGQPPEGAARPRALLQPRQGQVQRQPQRQHDHPGDRAPRPARQGPEHVRDARARVVRVALPRARQARCVAHSPRLVSGGGPRGVTPAAASAPPQ